MRVGIRIILSVLSSSVLAAVIPNNDDHGILLVRRAGNPDNKVVLWRRADEEQEGSEPSGSGASGGGSSPNLPSDNNGLGNPGKPQRSAKGFGASLKKGLANPRQKYVQWVEQRRIKTAVREVARVIEGDQAKQVISDIQKLLTNAVNSARKFLTAYNNQDNGPFSLSIPRGRNQDSLAQEMNAIRNTAKKHAKAHLENINRVIMRLTKNPRKVMMELKDIVSLIARFHYFLATLRDDTYKPLLLRMQNMDNSAHLKVTETHILRVKDDNTLASRSLKSIQTRLNNSMARFKDYASSEKPRVASKLKRRERVKGESSAGATSNQEETPN
ncbi:hypothetical protein BASA50_004775 [Batrachochytrium salamandrivorans]|uniref:Uncharacterized protein n=1 Tax=Batrachochytrium salamandrivorans TaxID=1357716 RepID=A0ABQ8FEP6_9FUNG|nr:hypothetical protein BASA50_004775 [Batrachochytrium salamandrivorans]KAH9273439.1 hypothetical protein BASA83_004104 [Batrachochytrium salamandrivorans]